MRTSDRPNILIIMTEQHRGDCLSIENHPVLQTPTMDEIGFQGGRFTRAYSSCPVCIPARASFLTGRVPSSHGVVGYAHTPWQGESFAHVLSREGYQTAWIGRSMHQDPATHACGFETTRLSDMRIPHDDYDQFLAGNQPEGGGGYYGAGIMYNDWTARPFHLSETLHHTNWTVNQSLDWLKQRDEDRPYCLVVSFLAAHPPLIPPACYFDRYIRTGVPDPLIGDWATPPENHGLGLGASSTRVHLTGEALLSARAGYYGLINHMDDQLHRLLNRVSGIDDSNTAVILTSDHGEMLGDHYYWGKSLPYEGAARIPLLIKAPKQVGIIPQSVLDVPVGLEDILPTVLDLAGVPVPDTVDGCSLLPVLRGETRSIPRDSMHIECAPTFHALTNGNEKYVWFVADGREQLFDLGDDPDECRDLSGHAAWSDQLKEWRTRMIARLMHRPEGFVRNGELNPGQTYRRILEG